MSWFEQVTSKHKVLFNATSLPRDAKAQTVQRAEKSAFSCIALGIAGIFFRFLAYAFLRALTNF